MSLHPFTPREHAVQTAALRAGFSLRKEPAGHYVVTDRQGAGIIRASPGTLEEVEAFLADANSTKGTTARVRSLKSRAKKLGFRFYKSAWRANSIDNMGGYQVVDVSRNAVVHGARFDCSIEDVAAFLDLEEAE